MRAYTVFPWDKACWPVLDDLAWPWVLSAFGGNKFLPEFLNYVPEGLMLDSGAYGAWTHGAEIDRNEMVEWAEMIRGLAATEEVLLFNLDVIPGEKGRRATEAERAAAAEQSAENAEALRAQGFSIIEVFHGGEPLRYLDEMLDRRQPGELIAVGGMGALPMASKVTACQQVFAHLGERYGWDALPPVHALGIAVDTPLARRFPWFSCDATSWFTSRNMNLHAVRSGKFRARIRETAPRTTADMRYVFSMRRLRRWQRYEQSLTALWKSRGVRFDRQTQAA